MRVLVLEAENKNALAAIRSLGRHGVDVVSGSKRRLARGRFSRYSTRGVVLPPPEQEEDFVTALLEVVERYGIDVVLPIGDASARTLSKHKELVAAHAALPLADWPAMQIAAFKLRTFAFAAEHGIPTPRTYPDKNAVDAFPVVVKRSAGTGGVRYVNSREELTQLDASDAVIQEYVPGQGFGFFALFEHGVERAIFMHRRIREYPVTGGASTAAESFSDPTLRELGLKLLHALDWHGVAMVEFKRDARDGEYKLMEINPKFWGSLDLAITAGVDFPWLAVQMALGKLSEPVLSYQTGLRFRWVFDDLMHLAARPSSLPDFLRDFRRDVKHDLWLSDPKPALLEAVKTVASIVARGASGRLRHPHGLPDVGAAIHAPRAGANADAVS